MRIEPLCCVAIALSLGVVADAEGRDEAGGPDVPLRASTDTICGPRCVRFVLDHFGRGPQPDLLQLAREAQWPNFEDGATVAKLDKPLRRSGLSTRVVEVVATATICWKDPAILYLNTPGQALGHYVVLMPDSTPKVARIWSGLSGFEDVPTWMLAQQMGGPVILTSTTPILGIGDTFRITYDGWLRKTALTLGAAATGAVIVAWMAMDAVRSRGSRFPRQRWIAAEASPHIA